VCIGTIILELNATNKTQNSDFELLESGAVIRSFRDKADSYKLVPGTDLPNIFQTFAAHKNCMTKHRW
jgi:hypothetical protein